MKVSRIPSNLCRIFLCLALLLGLAQGQVFADGGKSKSGSTESGARLWDKTAEGNLAVRGQRLLTPQKYVVFRLNQTALNELLARMPLEFTQAARAKTVIMEVPMPDRQLARFRIEESPMLAPSVAAELPGVRTFSGQGIDDPTATARFDWTPLKGFHGYIISQVGTVYIDPYQENDRENYLVYYKHEYGATGRKFHCALDESLSRGRAGHNASILPDDFTNGTDLRTYRLAIAGSGEYTTFHGGQTNALAAVVTAVNRLIGIYRREVAISFTLVSGENTLFPDPGTDPYDNSGDGGQLTINQTQLDTIIGNGNYDIGHLFVTSNGGVATSPSVCSAQKAEGLSGQPMPTGDPFVVDYVAHEIGHQFSADHTYNVSGDGGCTTRAKNDAFEPGSGATILSYCGICAPRNLQGNSFDAFHVQSLTQIITFRNDVNSGGSCGTVTTPGNTAPVIGALASFTIPRNTPFTLTATATDANDPANQLTYSWEEYDLGPPSGTATTFDTDADGMARPIFRSMAPSAAGATRIFPSLTYILNNANVPPVTYTGTSATGAVCAGGDICVTGESLPSIGRVMNFRMTVRDNNGGSGGAADAAMTVTVDGATGPFAVTSPNTNVTWTANSTQTVTWDANGSNANAADVKILLSTDGGQTFPTTVLATTANNGTAQITVPNVTTAQARIKIEGVNNIFFDISDANFEITGGTPTPTRLGNISTRLRVETGDNALIGGFIVTGTQPKRIIVRAIGPSLPLADTLADPTLELRDSMGAVVMANDNWRSTQEAEITATGVAPTNDAESAIVAVLPANNAGYTAIVRGANDTTGIGVVEAYDLDGTVDSRLGNISTRGSVQTGNNVLIAGTIVLGQTAQRVIVRALGPSTGVPGAMADPTLELRDGNGGLLASNDNWRSTQEAEITATGIPPTNDAESAIVQTLPGNNAAYTAIVRGANNTTGIAVVEIYAIAAAPAANPALFVANGGDATVANSSVTKANLDGTGGASLGNIGGFLNTPQGVAINAAAGKMYITNEVGNTVTMSNLDGSGAVNLTFGGLLDGPYGIALDVAAGRVYVATGGGGTTPRVVAADLAGDNAMDLGTFKNLLTGAIPQGMAVNPAGGKMYVALQQGSKVIQANLDGTGAVALAALGGVIGAEIPLDVTLDVPGNRMYVVTFEGNLFTADLSGNNAGNLGNLGGTLNAPRGIGLDLVAQKMYVGNSGNSTLTQADLPDGANPVALTVATLNTPAVVAVYRP